ncbi:uncharacterized protein Bfra_007506 [Botrytis fragariae]|uniref:Uncharacterized protein n=1 Tax=Botrytis fragariae TaxID=1964551 RepID=A0A8H6AJ46_9HELO|nr:uncharacterized protein Bfra_007506 [Botrytis fragariae]KAF5868309.1 hypothetical protein Bfra_007506 [Botrytis fragariae]
MELESLKLSSSLPLDDTDQRLCPYASALCRCPVPKDSNNRSVRPYIVYPVDGNIVDAATQQLESFGPQAETRLNPHISLNGWGVLYWEIHLTQDQVAELRENPEVMDVDTPQMHHTVL